MEKKGQNGDTYFTKEKIRFINVPSKVPFAMLIVNGVFYASPITIAICPIIKENFINLDILNQLQVSESIIEKNGWNKEHIN